MRAYLYEGSNQGEVQLIRAFAQGMKKYGLEGRITPKTDYNPSQLAEADLIVTGRLAASNGILKDAEAQGTSYVYFDKGYTNRGWKTQDANVYYRFSVNGFHPLDYFQDEPRPADRWKRLKIELKPRRTGGKNIVFAGCTHKFARFNDFEPHAYAAEIVKELRRYTDRPIVYRPKPSDHGDATIPGTTLSDVEKPIENELKNCHALVTFSSNAAMDAIVAGVPAFVLGPSIAKPVSNSDLSQIESPRFPTDAERLQWACDLAYCQWNFGEIQSGVVWKEIERAIARLKQKRTSSFSSS